MHLPARAGLESGAVGAVDEGPDLAARVGCDRGVVLRRNFVDRSCRGFHVVGQQQHIPFAGEVGRDEFVAPGGTRRAGDFRAGGFTRERQGQTVVVGRLVAEGFEQKRLFEDAFDGEPFFVVEPDHHVVHVVIAPTGPQILESVDALEGVGRFPLVIVIDHRHVHHRIDRVGVHREDHIAEVLVGCVVLE